MTDDFGIIATRTTAPLKVAYGATMPVVRIAIKNDDLQVFINLPLDVAERLGHEILNLAAQS